MKIALIIALIILLGLIALLIYMATKLVFGEKKIQPKEKLDVLQSPNNSTKTPDIKELLKFASDRSKSRNDLANLVYAFCQLKWPPFSTPASKEAELYLSFILLIANHKNSDAKLVTYLNSEAKKLNPEYSSLIEEYENIGLSSRKK